MYRHTAGVENLDFVGLPSLSASIGPREVTHKGWRPQSVVSCCCSSSWFVRLRQEYLFLKLDIFLAHLKKKTIWIRQRRVLMLPWFLKDGHLLAANNFILSANLFHKYSEQEYLDLMSWSILPTSIMCFSRQPQKTVRYLSLWRKPTNNQTFEPVDKQTNSIKLNPVYKQSNSHKFEQTRLCPRPEAREEIIQVQVSHPSCCEFPIWYCEIPIPKPVQSYVGYIEIPTLEKLYSDLKPDTLEAYLCQLFFPTPFWTKQE